MVLKHDQSSRQYTKKEKGKTFFKTRRKRALPVLKSAKKESKRAPKDRSAVTELRESGETATEAEQEIGSVEDIGSYRWQRWRT